MHSRVHVAALSFALAFIACSDPVSPVPADAPATTALPGVLTTQPNIILVVTDDQRLDQGVPMMPLLRKQVADSGITFARGLHTGTVCCASRAILYSGQAQHNNHVLDNYGVQSGSPAFDHTSSIAVALQSAGYLTALIGKYMNNTEAMGPLWTAPGWDEWRVYKEGPSGSPFVARYYNYTLTEKPFGSLVAADSTYATGSTAYSTTVIRRKALDFLNRAPLSQPVFLVLTPYAPHTAVDVLSQDVGKCKAIAFPEAPSSNEVDVSDKPAWLRAKPRLSAGEITASQTSRRKQCESLQAVDRLVNDVVHTLRTSGRLANSLFVFTSDNGFMWNEHRLKNRKHVAYLEGITTPLVIRGTGVARGIVDTSLVHIADLPATFRELAGIGPGALQHGRSLVPLLTSPNQPWTDELLIEHEVITQHPEERFTALRTGQFAYIESPAAGPGGTPFVELYDLLADPWQMTNVAAQPAFAGTVAALAARLAIRRSQP